MKVIELWLGFGFGFGLGPMSLALSQAVRLTVRLTSRKEVMLTKKPEQPAPGQG